MAIIGNLYKLQRQFADWVPQIVFDYFNEALTHGSSVHERIFALPVGSFDKVPLNDTTFALEQVFHTKKREECFIESHRKYIDFQLILSGMEAMEYIDIDKLRPDAPYDETKDLIIYPMVDFTSRFLLQKGDLVIFFPDDAHVGLPMHETTSLVHKTVIKLPTELWCMS